MSRNPHQPRILISRCAFARLLIAALLSALRGTLILAQLPTGTLTAPTCHFDVVGYHAGPAGLAAAVAAASEGC
ncbi:MAG: hypothetical protein ACK5MO_14075, partial [Planctomyces sp.]